MKEYITYFLHSTYYRNISQFCNEILPTITVNSQNTIDDFMKFIKINSTQELRSRHEYELEFLIIGVLWNTYKPQDAECTSDFFKKLLIFLDKSNEFPYEVQRLITWKLFFKKNDENYSSCALKTAADLGLWFEKKAKQSLGIYTENVKNFLNTSYLDYGSRDDNFFCGRREVEYHLNMLGAEILNNCFKSDFKKAEHKKVFLPSCMCLNSKDVCQKRRIKNGFLCTGCSPRCEVNKITKLGADSGFEVLVISHNTDVFSGQENIKYGTVGIIGIACILNLIEGGLKARSLNLMPQCVILDYCGCKRHWDRHGIPTSISFSKLFEILQIK